jgi:hypothetical protein
LGNLSQINTGVFVDQPQQSPDQFLPAKSVDITMLSDAAINAIGMTFLTTKGDLLTTNGTVPARLGVGLDGYALVADSSQTYGIKWASVGLPLTTKGDLVTRDATSNIRLPVGTDGYVVMADAAQTAGIKWAPAVPLAAKGDLLTRTASANAVLPIGGTDGSYLVVDSTQTTGMKWSARDISNISLSGVAIDWSLGGVFYKDISSAGTYTFTFSNNTNGRTIILTVKNTSGSTITLAFPTLIKESTFPLTVAEWRRGGE